MNKPRRASSLRSVTAALAEVMYCYFVMAKLDENNREFNVDLVNQKYPNNYALVPGHVWLVATDDASSYDVAQALGLVTGGNEEASGVVVPAKGYWGFAHNDLWRLLQPTGNALDADPKGFRRFAEQ